MRQYSVVATYYQTNTRSRVTFTLDVLAYKKAQVVPVVRKWLGLRRGTWLRVKFDKKSWPWIVGPKVIRGREED